MTSNSPVANMLNIVSAGLSSSSPFLTVVESRAPTPYDVNYPLTKRWMDSTTYIEYFLLNMDSSSGTVLANWVTVGTTTDDVNSFIPDNGTSPVVPTAAGVISVKGQSVPNTSGIQVTGALNELDISMLSPFQGSFNFTLPTSGATTTLSVSNTSNTASSNAVLLASVAGTSSGDAWTQWTIGTSTSWALGPDTSASGRLLLNYSASASISPSTGTPIAFFDPVIGSTIFGYAGVGSSAGYGLINTGGGSVRFGGRADGGTGDVYELFDLAAGSASAWEIGANRAAMQLQINYNPNAGIPGISGSPGFAMSNTGLITFNSAYSFPLIDGAAGTSLTTNGAGVLSFQNTISSVVSQVFTASGTYTPTSGMLYCIIEVIGAGGAGGGSATGSMAVAGGGGGGGYARGLFTSVTIGASQVITIGAGGAPGAAGANNGGNGGATSVGALISATGGLGGLGNTSTGAGSVSIQRGGEGGVGTGGDFQTTGTPGGTAIGQNSTGFVGLTGTGGSSFFGGGARARLTGSSAAAGLPGTSYGGGGSGGGTSNGSGDVAGGAGFAGIVIVTEYIG